MQPDTNTTEQRLIELEKKVDAMTVIVKRLYMIFLFGVILTVIGFVLPLVGLLFAIPKFMSNYNSMLGI